MNKEYFKRRYHDEQEEVIDLAFIFQNMDKAKRYIVEIDRCRTYKEFARLILKIYLKGDIDPDRAKSEERFISPMLKFATGLDVVRPNAHAAANYVRPLIDEAVENDEREKYQLDEIERELRRKNLIDEEDRVNTPLCIPKYTSIEECRRIIHFARSLGVFIISDSWQNNHTMDGFGGQVMLKREVNIVCIDKLDAVVRELTRDIEEEYDKYKMQGEVKDVARFIYEMRNKITEQGIE